MTGKVDVTVHLPRILATMLGVEDIASNGNTVGAALINAVARHPGLGLHIFDEAGEFRRHIRIVHNGARIPNRHMKEHKVGPGDEIAIIHAVSGG